MISPPRRVSYRLLTQIDAGRIFSDDALNSELMERLEVRDRHLATEIVYGTLRWQGALDYMAAKASSRSWQKVEAGARILLRMGIYQMWQMDRIPDHALVNDAVEIAKRELGKGIDRYINGILRFMGRTRPWKSKDFLNEAPAWVRVSLPQWLWERWSSRFGEAAAAQFALSLNQPPPHAFRLGKAEPEELPFEAIRSDLVPGAAMRLGSLSEGDKAVEYQDEASQLIPHLLGPLEGCRIWDACAAPGGKTAILARLCGKAGRVVATDLSQERISLISRLIGNPDRLDMVVADASVPAPFRCKFDAVFADAPCSGLGTLRRNPEIKWRFDPKMLDSMRSTQSAILNSVSSSVGSGGLLLYSTCSTEPEENEQVIELFLRTHPEFEIKRPQSPSGISRWIEDDGMVRTFPGTRPWDGFFAALMIRR